MFLLQYLLFAMWAEVRLVSSEKKLYRLLQKRKNRRFKGNWCYLDRKNAMASRKCKALRVVTTKVMQTAEFKDYCRETLGMAPSDFLAQECAKVTASISEAAVSTLILTI